MRTWIILGTVIVFCIGIAAPALSDGWKEQSGRGRCQDNIFVERLWWTLKHHYLYLHTFNGGTELRQGLTA
jgi:hypothetical protein